MTIGRYAAWERSCERLFLFVLALTIGSLVSVSGRLAVFTVIWLLSGFIRLTIEHYKLRMEEVREKHERERKAA